MKLAIYCFCIFLAGCAHHLTKNEISSVLNSRVGQPYELDLQEKLIKEDEDFIEYQSTPFDGCSWIVRVNIETNTVESWRFSSEGDSCRDGMYIVG